MQDSGNFNNRLIMLDKFGEIRATVVPIKLLKKIFVFFALSFKK
jgi:hypothetical protein